LLVNWLGADDFAFVPRRGAVVAYYNGQYVEAQRESARLAGWLNDPARAAAWTRRAREVGARFDDAFWDPSTAAFQDTTDDAGVHPEDGNAFAVLAGLATPAQARSAFAYLDRTTQTDEGNTIADTDGWRGPNWGHGDNRRIYPFIAYFDVLARYTAGADDSALDLIRREWGAMATQAPGTMWR
jgi:hypothetical protein